MLNIKCCEIGLKGSHEITKYLQDPDNFQNLESLVLDGNEFDIAGISCLWNALLEGIPQRLTSLSMSRCCFTEDAFFCISRALQSPKCKLTSLDLSSNVLSNRAVRMLSRSLRWNKTLRILNLSRDSFSETSLRERYDDKSVSRVDQCGVYVFFFEFDL